MRRRNSNRFGYVSDICVLPAFRGRRIASQLLDAMELRLRDEGATLVRLFTLAAESRGASKLRTFGLRGL